jgi:hypothetical protein
MHILRELLFPRHVVTNNILRLSLQQHIQLLKVSTGTAFNSKVMLFLMPSTSWNILPLRANSIIIYTYIYVKPNHVLSEIPALLNNFVMWKWRIYIM